MTIGKHCQITGAKKARGQVVSEVHGIVVTAPALMTQVYGDPPTPREEVRARVRYCAVCGAEQAAPLPDHCPGCNSPLTSEVGERELQKAGAPASFSRRIIAFLIDALIIAVLAWLAVRGISLIEASVATPALQGEGEVSIGKFFIMSKVIAALAVFIGYHTLFTAALGATPGKLIFGIRVYLKNGSPKVGFGKSLVRSALYLFTIYVVPIGLLPLIFQEPPGKWPGIIERDAMFHDSLTDTVVIKPGV